MIDIRTGKDLKDISILKEPMIYIYVFLNEEGRIKIGKTKDIHKRYLSLCGSNGQGIDIYKCYCSSATYLYTLENIMHDKFSKYRIPNTEWFYDKADITGEGLFIDATEELELLFSSAEYEKCNELRRSLNEGGDECDY